jgi:hypothetical protein
MKKIILSLAMMVISTAAFSQKSIGLFTEFSEPSTIGASFEFKVKKDKENKKQTTSSILNVGFNTLSYDIGNTSITGTGFTIQAGQRTYFDGPKGWYSENFLIYSSTKFDEVLNSVSLKGKYSYWSIINPTVGYRFELGKIAIDPSIGINWKWEVKGTGIIDNKEINNLTWKAGIRLAYKL